MTGGRRPSPTDESEDIIVAYLEITLKVDDADRPKAAGVY